MYARPRRAANSASGRKAERLTKARDTQIPTRQGLQRLRGIACLDPECGCGTAAFRSITAGVSETESARALLLCADGAYPLIQCAVCHTLWDMQKRTGARQVPCSERVSSPRECRTCRLREWVRLALMHSTPHRERRAWNNSRTGDHGLLLRVRGARVRGRVRFRRARGVVRRGGGVARLCMASAAGVCSTSHKLARSHVITGRPYG